MTPGFMDNLAKEAAELTVLHGIRGPTTPPAGSQHLSTVGEGGSRLSARADRPTNPHPQGKPK